ncbi:MAG: hypothetical protein JWN74_1619 [Acidobacteriaceae bacterium]|nr:hypothetical protein [Acidobacteriaceae bacterium]
MIAVDAARSITSPSREEGEWQALVSIAFSVITLEAFLNEATEFAGGQPSNSGTTAVFAQVMGTFEKMASLEKKLSVAHSLLAGKPANFGAAPYQNLSLLVAVRNELLHFKPTAPLSFEPEYHPVREGLRKRLSSLHVLAEGADIESWIFHVATRAMAEWSCNVGRDVAVDLLDNAKAAGVAVLHGYRETFSHKFF